MKEIVERAQSTIDNYLLSMTEFLEQDDDSKLMSSSIYLAAFLKNSMVADDAEGCRSGITHRT